MYSPEATSSVSSPRGYTLLEVLLAVVLLAAVVTSSMMLLSSSRAVEQTVQRQIARSEQVQLAFDQIERALTTCLPPGGDYAEGLAASIPEEEAAPADSEEAPAVQLTTVSAAGIGRFGGQLRRFTFQFAVPPEGETGRLMMTVSPVGEDLSTAAEDGSAEAPAAATSETVALVDGLAAVRLRFFDGTQWAMGGYSSSGQGGLPQGVRVELWFTAPPPEGEETSTPAPPPGTMYARTFRVPAAAGAAAPAATEGGGRVIR
jgi:prepilin-type N-terminal cleavage/methylation domain-containing protein